jgi:rhamnogalacturonyl hydrolase YesR
MSESIRESLERLRIYAEGHDFKGYDLYDTLLSPLPFHWLGKWGPVLATQFQKRNPVNIRPLLGIPKQRNPKGIGLFLHSYSLLAASSKNREFAETAKSLFQWLKEHRSSGYSGSCWGYNFPWAGPEKAIKPFTPSSVVTGFVTRGIHQYYLLTGDPEAKKLILDAVQFVLNDLPVTEDKTGICFSYTPMMKDVCYNASLLAAEVLARAYDLGGNEKYRELAGKACDFVIARQKGDGRWNYSLNMKTGEERTQVDFHQGYVLESLFEIRNLCKTRDGEMDRIISNGLEFYTHEQILPDGRTKWRWPHTWPVEIHNQAQGIITLSRLANYHADYAEIASKVADWTIRHMQDSRGYFYHQVHQYHTIKIPYMRWSQAWMMLALSTLLKNQN